MGTSIETVVHAVDAAGNWEIVHRWGIAMDSTLPGWIGRQSYWVLYVLAGVREMDRWLQGFGPVSNERGIPDDVQHLHRGKVGKLGSYGIGEWGHTWCTVQEVYDWPHWDVLVSHTLTLMTMRELCAPLFEELEEMLATAECQDLSSDPTKVRIVMGFDS